MRVQQLIEDDLNKRSVKLAHKSTSVARGADMQLGSSCVSAPLATNVDLWNHTVVTNPLVFVMLLGIVIS